jgi:glycosyltransferase involved in cell wall biosynthesis
MTVASLVEAEPGEVSGKWSRVAITHDWLVRYGGAERCLDEMLELFPDADLYTSVIKQDGVPEAYWHARPSFLQRLPGGPSHHERLLPLMPCAWRLRKRLVDYDLVISSSYACAKSAKVGDGIPHVCYCYTPIRYAWDFAAEQHRVPAVARGLAGVGMGFLRRWDARMAQDVSGFIAISSAVARRIEAAYGRTSLVVHPPVDTTFYSPAGPRDDFFLYVGRLVSYKQSSLVVDAFCGLPDQRLIVIGTGHLEQELKARATPNISFRRDLDAEALRDLYRSARALVYPANEDFGIVMAEAISCGTPVIGLNEGGARDIVVEGCNGWLIDAAEVSELRASVRRAAREELDRDAISATAERFSAELFGSRFLDAVSEVVSAGRL